MARRDPAVFVVAAAVTVEVTPRMVASATGGRASMAEVPGGSLERALTGAVEPTAEMDAIAGVTLGTDWASETGELTGSGAAPAGWAKAVKIVIPMITPATPPTMMSRYLRGRRRLAASAAVWTISGSVGSTFL
jgi:hypothetical protein